MRLALLTTWLLLSAIPVCAADPAPPLDLKVEDVENDDGTRLILTWTLSPDDDGEDKSSLLEGYRIERKSDPPEAPDKKAENVAANLEPPDPDGFREITILKPGSKTFTDEKLKSDRRYFYRLTTIAKDGGESASVLSVSAISPIVQWFDMSKLWFGIFLAVVCGSVVIFIEIAKSGRDLKIRKIAGLEAIEEAVGRATEMGREVLFVPGIQDINDIQTVAGLIVLNRVAELTAEYDADLNVPTTRSLVMTVARETVQAAYLKEGRPELYNPDDIYYLTDEQFGYVAGVTGKMVRDKPAACIYMGAFYAESLIFAETANTVGAIQIAGTAMPSQLPFFVAACDYVLIGEEFFAASAYLSGEPKQLGSLKGQDVGKLVAGILILVGAALMTILEFSGAPKENGVDTGWISKIVTWIKDGLLSS